MVMISYRPASEWRVAARSGTDVSQMFAARTCRRSPKMGDSSPTGSSDLSKDTVVRQVMW